MVYWYWSMGDNGMDRERNMKKDLFVKRIDADLLDRIKKQARAERRTIKAVITRALEDYLDKMVGQPVDEG